MKSLISIIAVILVLIMAFAAISSLTDSVASGGGGGSSTTTAATTTTADLPFDNPVDEGLVSLVDHGHYFSDADSLNIQSGVLSSQASDTTAFGFVLQNLVPGKTYFFRYSVKQLFLQNTRAEVYYLRTGGPKDSVWDKVPVGEYDVNSGCFCGAYEFTAETTSAEFFLRKMSYVSDSDSVSLMAESMKQYVKEIVIFEVVKE